MKDRDIYGVTFRSAYFTPMFGKYEGEMVGGVQVHMDDPSQVDLVNLGQHLVDAMRDQNPEKFEMTSSYANLIGDTEVPDMIMNNEPVEDIIGSWREELDTWVEDVRNQYIMYPPYSSGSTTYKEVGIFDNLTLVLTAGPVQKIDLKIKCLKKKRQTVD